MSKTTQPFGVGSRPGAMILFLAAGILLWDSSYSRAQSSPAPTAKDWLNGIRQFEQMKEATSIVLAPASACSTVIQWTQIGPAPLLINPVEGADGRGPDSGMVRDIAIDPTGSTDQTIYVATDNGGIWKTTDAGVTWSPKSDFMPSLCMGAVALDKGNPSIVYAGTGNFLNQGFFKGAGIYKSANGGDTWGPILGASIFTGVIIDRIVVPAPSVLLVASGTGLYRSVDGGQNFGNNSPTFNNSQPVLGGFITDVDVDTANASVVYASVYGSGVFKSTDGGATFPTNLFTSSNGAPTGMLFIVFAQSTSPNNQKMYVTVQLSSGGVGMYKSVNAGTSWTPISIGTLDGSAAGYGQTIGVDPQDGNRVYIGLKPLYLSTDGGASGITSVNRIDLNQIHADQHALVFSPSSHYGNSGPPTLIYTGTDGGIATNIAPTLTPSNDGGGNPAGSGNNWTLLNGDPDCGNNAALATLLFRQIDMGRGNASNNEFTYGAAQDLGLSSHRGDCFGTPWLLGRGGDGTTIAVDPLDGNHAIGEEEGFRTSTVDGKSWPTTGGGFPASPSLLYFDPGGGVAYGVVNGNQLYRSSNNGNTFSSMTAFASNITAINMVRGNSTIVWVGLANGTLAYTTTAQLGFQAAWSGSVVAGASGQPIVGIAIDPSDIAQIVAVCPSGRAFMTTNFGTNWIDISGSSPNASENLPNLPLNAVVIDPNTSPYTIIVASDAGVMRTVNLGATWQVLGAGLPTVKCTSLVIDSSVTPSLLRVGTYGRSAFELTYYRLYVDWRNNAGGQDGSLLNPFHTVGQAVNASAGMTSINIQAGTYSESQTYFNQCVHLSAINGAAYIQRQ